MKNEIQITEEQEAIIDKVADIHGYKLGCLYIDNPIELILAIVDSLSPEQRKKIAEVKEDPDPETDKRQLQLNCKESK
jgi:hypothetical protein